MAQTCGLVWPSQWYCDSAFLCLCALGIGGWMVLWITAQPTTRAWPPAPLWLWAAWVLWQPCWEELLFRGLGQGMLREWTHARTVVPCVSLANLLTSAAFGAAHLAAHAPAWAGGILLVSLLLGWCRDRWHSVIPPLALHCLYNAGFFLLLGR